MQWRREALGDSMTTRLLGERPNEQLPCRRICSRPGDSNQAPAFAKSMKAFYSNGGKRKARTFGSWQKPNCWNNYRQMARCSFLVVAFFLFAAGGFGLAETPAEAARAMVEAERKFYQTGQEQGTRAAFLAFLADDAIVFRPGPVNGKETWSKRPETGLDLVWEPTFAVVARSADFGFDTGPAKWRAKKTDPKFSGYGYFISDMARCSARQRLALPIPNARRGGITSPCDR
jgi:hypothetical protein